MENTPTFRAVLFVFGLAGWVAVELAQWLAQMPDTTAFALRSVALLAIAGPRALRAAARAVGQTPRDPRDRERGSIGLELLYWVGARFALVAAVAVTVYMLAGCAPRHVRAERSIRVHIDPGPPCVVILEADGRLLARADWPKPCPPSVVDP